MRKMVVILVGVAAALLLGRIIADANPINPARWYRIDTSAPPRYEHNCAFDDQRNMIVLFGGRDDSDSIPGDTWEFFRGWNRVSTSGPCGRVGHGMCYDTSAHAVILFGGRDANGNYLNDMWSWDGTSWTTVSVLNPPAARGFFSMVYEACRGRILLFGGTNDDSLFGDTWVYGGDQWTLANTEGPSARIYSGIGYMCLMNYSYPVLFGGKAGFDGPSLNDTWWWNGTAWSLVPLCPNTPSPRFGHSMAFIEYWADDYFVLFGGQSGTNPDTVFDETWDYYDCWWPSYGVYTSPPARTMAVMLSSNPPFYHNVLIGGTDGTQVFGDVWMFGSPLYQYVPGDINNSGAANGIDIVYGVNYFKGGAPPSLSITCAGVLPPFYASGDVNGDCVFNGIDITYYVAYLKGLQSGLLFCANCPPTI